MNNAGGLFERKRPPHAICYMYSDRYFIQTLLQLQFWPRISKNKLLSSIVHVTSVHSIRCVCLRNNQIFWLWMRRLKGKTGLILFPNLFPSSSVGNLEMLSLLLKKSNLMEKYLSRIIIMLLFIKFFWKFESIFAKATELGRAHLLNK